MLKSDFLFYVVLIMGKFIIVASCMLLSACATSPVSIDNAAPVPAERLLAFQDATAGEAEITVIRDKGFTGGGCYGALIINNILAGRFDVSEAAVFYLPVGETLLRYGRDPEGKALCSTGQDHWVQRETVLKHGDKKTFRLSIDANGKLDVMRVN